MLRADHDFADALRALSVPSASTPGGVSRRRFLQGIVAAGTLAAPVARPAAGAAATRPHKAFEPSLVDTLKDNANLVVFTLGGGNDGLATVSPVGPSPLDALRPDLLVPTGLLLDLGDGWGLHPALANLHGLWQAEELAVIGGVAASGNLSHFDSVAEWFCTMPDPAGGDGATGFVGRWLDTFDDADDVPLRAVSLTTDVPIMLVGRRAAACGMSTSAGSMLGADRSNPVAADLFDTVTALGADAADDDSARSLVARLGARSVDLASRVGPAYQPPLPVHDPSMVKQATLAARLLNDAALGCRVVFCSFGSFDHHRDLVDLQAATLTELDAAVGALFATLDPAVAARTVVLIHSEFGRRPSSNGGGGTDHGTASYAFVAGPRVLGGRLYGAHPDLVHLDGNGNPPIGIRHTDVLSSVMAPWMGADPADLFEGATEDLGLFRLDETASWEGNVVRDPAYRSRS